MIVCDQPHAREGNTSALISRICGKLLLLSEASLMFEYYVVARD